MNKAIKLKNQLMEIAMDYSISNSEKELKIYNCLCNNIREYSQMSSMSLQAIEYAKTDLNLIYEYQDKKIAYDMGAAALQNKDIEIRKEDPADWVDERGNLPQWAAWEERRTVKMWVLK